MEEWELINVSEQLSSYKVTIVSFCRQDEVMTPRSKSVAVSVVVGKELLQDMMLVVSDPSEQSFVPTNHCGTDR